MTNREWINSLQDITIATMLVKKSDKDVNGEHYYYGHFNGISYDFHEAVKMEEEWLKQEHMEKS